MTERGGFDAKLEKASTEDGKHTKTEAIRQCLLADRGARSGN